MLFSRKLMTALLVLFVAIYFGALAGLYFGQRRLLYFANGYEAEPAAVGLAQAEVLTLTTVDGERLLAWHIAPAPNKPLIVYFHGNGGGLSLRAARFHAFARAGFGVLAIAYRGYGGSTGSPSEAGLKLDGETAYAFARNEVAADRIVLLGESLGSGVAVALAAKHEIAALALDSPYTSIADIAARRFPMFPVRALLTDSFDRETIIGRIKAPLLIVHGDTDGVVPYDLSRRLFEAAPEPKRYITVAGAGHLAMGERLPETIAWTKAATGGAP